MSNFTCAAITFPLMANDGKTSILPINAALVDELTELAGGCTSTPALGHWIAPNGTVQSEPVEVHAVSIANVNREHARNQIASLAKKYGKLAQQNSVAIHTEFAGFEIIKINDD